MIAMEHAIGVPRKFYVDGLESDVATLMDEALATFGGLGARVVEVDLPDRIAISTVVLIVLAVEATRLHAPFLTRAHRRLWSAGAQPTA